MSMYISLGAACDAAGAIKRMGLRKTSLPFDWFWNLDEGLGAVTDMIDKDFSTVLSRDCYTKKRHYRFPEEQVVYSAYPGLVHMHSNPMDIPKDHETLVRRINRFKEILGTDCKKNFVYYRCFEEDRISGKAETVVDSLNLLIQESSVFLETVFHKYPGQEKKVKMLLVLETAERTSYDVFNTKRHKCHSVVTGIGHALTRNDGNEDDLDIWCENWEDCLIHLTGLSAFPRMKVFLLAELRALSRWLRRVSRYCRASAVK